MLVAQKWESSGVGGRYTVTFNLSGGKIGESSSNVIVYNVPRGKRIGKIKPSTNPYKRTDGTVYGGIHPFVGWNVSDDTRVLSDMTVYATYQSWYRLDWFASNNTTHNNTYTFESGTYKITVVGGGGWGHKSADLNSSSHPNTYAAAGGGSGALLIGTFVAASPISLKIGIGSSGSTSTLVATGISVSVPNGDAGYTAASGESWGGTATAGSGGSKDSIVATGISVTSKTSGNQGTGTTHVAEYDSYGAYGGGGASPISGTSYGAGAEVEAAWSGSDYSTYVNGSTGYVKIERI